MLGLYEIMTGWMGSTDSRVYAWADSPEEALRLAIERNKHYEGKRQLVPDNKKIKTRLLFTADAKPFATVITSEGDFDL